MDDVATDFGSGNRLKTAREVHEGGYVLSTDKNRLDIEKIHGFLKRSYWASSRTRKVLEKSIEKSCCLGIYERHTWLQVGFARIITDYATFGYLCDMFIDEAHRNIGLAKWMLSVIMRDPELMTLRRLLLATQDAHGLYRQFGFEMVDADRFMEFRAKK